MIARTKVGPLAIDGSLEETYGAVRSLNRELPRAERFVLSRHPNLSPGGILGTVIGRLPYTIPVGVAAAELIIAGNEGPTGTTQLELDIALHYSQVEYHRLTDADRTASEAEIERDLSTAAERAQPLLELLVSQISARILAMRDLGIR